MIRFGRPPRGKAAARPVPGSPFPRERLVRCEKFAVERWRLRRPVRVSGRGEMAIFTAVEGAGEVVGDGFARPLRVGDTMLMPACLSAWSAGRATP